MIDPARLFHKLQVTGLQDKDPRLFQLIHEMIGIMGGLNTSIGVLADVVDGITDEVTDGVSSQQAPVLFTDDSGAGDDSMIIIQQIIGTGGGSFIPTVIDSDGTFTVPENTQALFAMNIDNEGIIDVEGFLIEVD